MMLGLKITKIFIPQCCIARTIPIVNQMLGRDASLDVGWRLVHNIVHGLLGANVFHRNLQGREFYYQLFHDFFNENRFPFENVGVRDLGMNTKHHPQLLHFFQDRVDMFDVRDAKSGISRSARWIVFAGNDGGCPIGVFERHGLPDFFRIRIVGEVEGHQRLKIRGILLVLL